ncbi:MAG: homoserine kinase [Acidimicrobiia bacterium]
MIGGASAPASSGNLGPGFDVLALALSLRCNATAEIAESMTLSENGSTRRLQEDDMISMAVRMAVARPMHITLTNEIPRARGLGSSSAVTAASAGAAMKAMGTDGGREAVYSIVNELEGHADNAAAAVYGGLVAATPTGIQRLELHESLDVVVAIPEQHLKTSDARAALPDSVDRDVVARSLGRLAFLIEGFKTGNPDTLKEAGGDELHEAPRAHLSPVTGDLMMAAIRAGALHAAWSGAGPTAIAFTTSANKGRVVGAMAEALGGNGEVLVLDVDADGLR